MRHQLAIEYAALNGLNHAVVNPSDAWIGIVASGITYRELREALRRLGLADDADIAGAGIRLMCMHMPIPFSPQRAPASSPGASKRCSWWRRSSPTSSR